MVFLRLIRYAIGTAVKLYVIIFVKITIQGFQLCTQIPTMFAKHIEYVIKVYGAHNRPT